MIKQTKVLGIVLLLLVVALQFFKTNVSFLNTLVLIIVVGITMLFVVGAKINQRFYYSAFWVEGLPIFWLVLLLGLGR